jgi:hypothetical protein
MYNSGLIKEGSMIFNDHKFIKSIQGRIILIFSINIKHYLIQVKGNKLIGILDNSLKSIDYLSICDKEAQKLELKINKILFQIDKTLVLINIKMYKTFRTIYNL